MLKFKKPLTENFIRAYDINDDQLGCKSAPHIPGLNPYDYQGFYSSEEPIACFVLSSPAGGSFYIDKFVTEVLDLTDPVVLVRLNTLFYY